MVAVYSLNKALIATSFLETFQEKALPAFLKNHRSDWGLDLISPICYISNC